MLTHDTPNIVASSHVGQVKRQLGVSWANSRECAPYFPASRIACVKDMYRLQRVWSLICAKAATTHFPINHSQTVLVLTPHHGNTAPSHQPSYNAVKLCHARHGQPVRVSPQSDQAKPTQISWNNTTAVLNIFLFQTFQFSFTQINR